VVAVDERGGVEVDPPHGAEVVEEVALKLLDG
jgi:hypothetical protein